VSLTETPVTSVPLLGSVKSHEKLKGVFFRSLRLCDAAEAVDAFPAQAFPLNLYLKTG
jgi:hypothetical protein